VCLCSVVPGRLRVLWKSVVDDCYSTMSALGNKGEKNQSKFKSIDINNLFKGSSVTPQKTAPGGVVCDLSCDPVHCFAHIVYAVAVVYCCCWLLGRTQGLHKATLAAIERDGGSIDEPSK